MDYSLVPERYRFLNGIFVVLILVVMDYSLVHPASLMGTQQQGS